MNRLTDPLALPGDHAAPSGDHGPVGVFDSGVGGLSILREVCGLLPYENVIFVADQGHVPYGPRTITQVRAFACGVVRYLLAQNCKLIVVACNTASAAALYPLRDLFPDTPFVGMEPAVKPAARDTRSGVIGVIATEATFQGELYASVVGRFAQDVRVITAACPEFVLLVEAGEISTPAAYQAVESCLAPLLAEGIDQLVLGCTHFPFLVDTIRAVAGPGVTIVDPSLPVARQAARRLCTHHLETSSAQPGTVTCCTSGDPAAFRAVVDTLLGPDGCVPPDVCALRWVDGALSAAV